jgi:RimJ/RimL family protein N-acetyltransferase
VSAPRRAGGSGSSESRHCTRHTGWPCSALGSASQSIGGGGYGTDALLLLVDYAFDWLDLRKVWLVTTSINVRVMRQMEKVGFALEGRLRGAIYADGAWYDDLFYGMLRDEWPGHAALVEKLSLRARE